MSKRPDSRIAGIARFGALIIDARRRELAELIARVHCKKGNFTAEGAVFRGEIQERNPFLSEFISVYQWLK